jgi:hypothetical protein
VVAKLDGTLVAWNESAKLMVEVVMPVLIYFGDC